MSTALIVDDNAETLIQLAKIFREKGYSAETSQTLAAAREALLRRMPEVALLNETVGGQSTLDLLEQLEVSRVMEIFIMSDEPRLEVATRAMRAGCSNLFRKPVDGAELARNLDELHHDPTGSQDIAELAAEKAGDGLLIGESQQMRRLRRLLRKVAPESASVLLAGESGTGKELAARTIHGLSSRAAGSFTALNCSAIAAELMESELFGHVKGSFTGATRSHQGIFTRADGGTLFLDEITELDPSLQAKLLRVLETQVVTPVGGEKETPIDVRIVSATNRDPQEAVDDGSLREDLYFRLAQFPVRVPPLRERGSDIELLSRHFLDEQNEARGVEKILGEDALEVFHIHDWPGNVRELRNAVIHGHLLAADVITADDLPDHMPQTSSSRRREARSQIGLSLQEVERRHILATYAHLGGEKKTTAEMLGISLKTLYNRLKKYDVA